LARTSNFTDVIRHELAENRKLDWAVEDAISAADVAAEIYRVRTAAGLTQSQLAKKVGTTQTVIARLEDAEYEGHSIKLLRRIANALGLSVRVCFGQKFTVPSRDESASDETITVHSVGWLNLGQQVAAMDDTDFEEVISTSPAPLAF
jgi:transcriptional regulator with XRE-family HTH domain